MLNSESYAGFSGSGSPLNSYAEGSVSLRFSVRVVCSFPESNCHFMIWGPCARQRASHWWSLVTKQVTSPHGPYMTFTIVCSRLNNDLQIYPAPNPWTCPDYLFWQKQLCRHDQVQDLEMRRLSWVIPVGPNAITRVIVIRGTQEPSETARRRCDNRHRRVERKTFEDAALLTLKMQNRSPEPKDIGGIQKLERSSPRAARRNCCLCDLNSGNDFLASSPQTCERIHLCCLYH